jgi:hypothetical protein
MGYDGTGHYFKFNPSKEDNMWTHMTKDGVEMNISTMTDEHLGNTINLYVRKLEEASQASIENGSPIQKLFYGEEDLKDIAERVIKLMRKRLPVYIFEASIRGLVIDEPLSRLRVVLGRRLGERRADHSLLLEGTIRDELD